MKEPKYIYSKWIPFSGYKLMAFWRWIFIRDEYKGKLTPSDYTHEKIHLLQQQEITVIMFLLIYGIELMIKLICTFNYHKAYRSVSFEQEAYGNQNRQSYLVSRERFAWKKYIFKLKG